MIQNDYAALLSRARAMAMSETPDLYQAMSEVTCTASPDFFGEQDALFIALALALALGGMLAIVAALVWPRR